MLRCALHDVLIKTPESVNTVRPKKHLGQHFLADPNIARNIVGALRLPDGVKEVLEIGPGMGVLTQYLLQNPAYQTSVVEIDNESVAYLKVHYPALADRIYATDFLKQSLATMFPDQPLAIIGNFPYNISSQIFFAVLNNRQQVREVVGMIQKEVGPAPCRAARLENLRHSERAAPSPSIPLNTCSRCRRTSSTHRPKWNRPWCASPATTRCS